jgi:hypothetical protein
MNVALQSGGSTILIIDVCAYFFENFYCITVLIVAKNLESSKNTWERDQKKILRFFFNYTKVQKRSLDLQTKK